METYEFRAWENGKMYYQVRVGGMFNGIPTTPTVWNKERGEWLNLTGGEYTKVMQYTGFKDRNGKKIYTGDILQVSKEYGENYIPIVVRFIDGAFQISTVRNLSHSILMGGISRTHEIIGNIYENPELMDI